MYTGGLLKRLKGLVYVVTYVLTSVVHSLTTLTPLTPLCCRILIASDLAILVKENKKYATEYDIIFNGKTINYCISEVYCSTNNKGIEFNGQYINMSYSAVHIYHFSRR